MTDALVVLGRISGETLAGGSFRIDRAASLAALRRLGRELGGRDALAAAEAVVAVADARIEAALRRVSVERGHDPRGAALVAFGGAGGLHACAVAGMLGVEVVLFPRHAGVLSALGALAGGSRREASRSVLIDAGDSRVLRRAWREPESRLGGQFGARRGPVRLERWAEVRYRGQSHELSLPVGGRGGRGETLADRFHREHERRFGFADRGRAVEVVTVEVRGSTPDQWRAVGAALARGSRSPRAAATRPARVRVRDQGAWIAAAVWERSAPAARRVRGPAIVLEEGATLWVAPGWEARVHATGTLVLMRAGPRRGAPRRGVGKVPHG